MQVTRHNIFFFDGPDGSFDLVVARKSTELSSNPDRVGYFSSRLCIYSDPNCSKVWRVISAVYGTVQFYIVWYIAMTKVVLCKQPDYQKTGLITASYSNQANQPPEDNPRISWIMEFVLHPVALLINRRPTSWTL